MFTFRFAPALAAALLTAALVAALPPAAPAQQPPPAPGQAASPESLFTPANRVQPGKLPYTLRIVFRRLARDRSQAIPFQESRTFAISKNPLKQSGTLRSTKENGLSLSYENPKPHVIVVDDKGLIDRQPDKERQINTADHPELAALTDLYLNLLRGNADKLFDYADVYFVNAIQSWQMGLVPHDATVAKRAGMVVISGNGHNIRRLENVLPGGESRVLELGKTEHNPQFTPDQTKAFFRAPGN